VSDEEKEQSAREMRDKLYGSQTDRNWNACKDAWLKDYDWLVKMNAPKPLWKDEVKA